MVNEKHKIRIDSACKHTYTNIYVFVYVFIYKINFAYKITKNANIID